MPNEPRERQVNAESVIKVLRVKLEDANYNLTIAEAMITDLEAQLDQALQTIDLLTPKEEVSDGEADSQTTPEG